MNRYQAEIVLRLPDGYDYEFLKSGRYVIGHKYREIILFKIEGDTLIQVEIKNK